MVSNCSRYFSSLVPERVRKVTTAAWKGGRNHEHDCRQHIDLIMVTLFITYLVGLRQSKPLLLLGESTRRSAAAVIRPGRSMSYEAAELWEQVQSGRATRHAAEPGGRISEGPAGSRGHGHTRMTHAPNQERGHHRPRPARPTSSRTAHPGGGQRLPLELLARQPPAAPRGDEGGPRDRRAARPPAGPPAGPFGAEDPRREDEGRPTGGAQGRRHHPHRHRPRGRGDGRADRHHLRARPPGP